MIKEEDLVVSINHIYTLLMSLREAHFLIYEVLILQAQPI